MPGARQRVVVGMLTLLGAPSFVAGQGLPPALAATRRETITQSQEARRVGDHARALELALRAEQLEATPTLRGFIAQEALTLQRWALALGEAQQCVAGAEHIAQRERALWVAQCQRVVDEARARVARVVVRMPEPPPEGVRILVGGEELPRPAWALPFVVDPGELVVEVTAPGFERFHRTLRLDPGARGEVNVVLVERPSPAAAPRRRPPVIGPAQPRPNPVPWIIAGAGALGFALTIPLHLAAESAYDDARACGAANGCEAYTRYTHLNEGTNAAFVVGGILLAVGVGWWVIDRVSAPPRPRFAALPGSSSGAPGAAVIGTF